MSAAGIIMKSTSAWRSQVVFVTNRLGKKRLAIDYASTINRTTALDAYPVPLIAEVLEQLHQYHYFSCLDPKSAYHQVPIKEGERNFTEFEALGA